MPDKETREAAERLIKFTIADDASYQSGQSRGVYINPLLVASVRENGNQRSTITMANGDKFCVCDFIGNADVINRAVAALNIPLNHQQVSE